MKPAEPSPVTEYMAESRTAARTFGRLTSLDAFRGLTVALMILVNNPGDWGNIYSPLKHAEWDGCTPTDLVFPFFLFIVGVAIPFAQAVRLRKFTPVQTRGALVRSILRRSAILFGLGLLLAAIPTRLSPGNGILDPANLRIMGVLQRIALCYLPVALLSIYFGWRLHAWAAVCLLALYSVLMLAVPVPGHGPGVLTLGGNLAAYIDGQVLGAHCYQNPPQHAHFWEPEGLLSTLPAIATTLFGLIAGQWLLTERSGEAHAAGLLVFGVLGAAAGYALDLALMPLNKGLWTPSYATYTAGLALLTLGTLFWIIDVQGWRTWARPAVIFGMNAIAIFVLSGVIGRLLVGIKVGFSSKRSALKTVVYENVYRPLGLSPEATSLLYGLTWIGVMFLITWVLYRRRIFIKV